VINGNTFKNDQGLSEPASTPFLTDFAASCNNAFARWYTSIGAGTLAQTARKYYGLNQPWNIGIGQGGLYYAIPSTAFNGELAQELFGQGQLEASPIAMASVGATVDTGSFKQPVVVPGQAQLTATPLPATVHQYLWQMMRAVTQTGTAAGVFNGIPSLVYGKTGTADVGGQGKPNSWMVVFDPTLDVAIGCLVLDAGFGASFAGPEAAAVLRQLSQG
jgi:cell division protein FtsI/penicillin-binding protein 2